MKKTILFSGIFSIAAALMLCAANWILALTAGEILGSHSMGGEYGADRGLGVLLETFYPETFDYDAPVRTMRNISFDPDSFFITLLVIFVFSIALGTLIRMLRSKK